MKHKFQFIEQTTFKNKVLKHVHNGSRKARALRLFYVLCHPYPPLYSGRLRAWLMVFADTSLALVSRCA